MYAKIILFIYTINHNLHNLYTKLNFTAYICLKNCNPTPLEILIDFCLCYLLLYIVNM